MPDSISSTQLRIFAAIAQRLHMGDAARDLGLTTSALSHSIRSLEADLGCRLIDRGKSGIALTTSGKELLPDVQNVIAQLDGLRKKMATRPEWKQRSLRIAASQSACQHLLPPVLREFTGSFSSMHISMAPCSAEEAARRIEEGSADLAVCPQTSISKSIIASAIGEDELRFLVPMAHPWTHRGRATQIGLQSLITPDRESDSYKLIKEHFKSEGLELDPLIETGSDEAIKQFIRIGLGVGVLPEWSARNEIETGSLCSVPLGRRRLRRTWCVLRSNSRPATLAEDLFTNLCQSVARDLMGPLTLKKTSVGQRTGSPKNQVKRRK